MGYLPRAEFINDQYQIFNLLDNGYVFDDFHQLVKHYGKIKIILTIFGTYPAYTPMYYIRYPLNGWCIMTIYGLEYWLNGYKHYEGTNDTSQWIGVRYKNILDE